MGKTLTWAGPDYEPVVEVRSMPRKFRDEYYQAALSFVNEILIEQGREPLVDLPAGKCGDSRNCPLARALGIDVGAYNLHDAFNTPLPDLVVDFVRRHDFARYRWLIDSE